MYFYFEDSQRKVNTHVLLYMRWTRTWRGTKEDLFIETCRAEKRRAHTIIDVQTYLTNEETKNEKALRGVIEPSLFYNCPGYLNLKATQVH